jgi:hypothetical protein
MHLRVPSAQHIEPRHEEHLLAEQKLPIVTAITPANSCSDGWQPELLLMCCSLFPNNFNLL